MSANRPLVRPRRLRSAIVAGAVGASLIVVATPGPAGAQVDPAATIFISEIHYDNAGTDTGEAVEITGPAGTDLTGWTLVGYNGNGGAVYNTVALSGAIDDEDGVSGAVSFAFAGLQNGAPDGIALVDDLGGLRQFLSYEGAFAGVGGAADGVNSTDIGVSESSSTPVGESLQLVGTGTMYGDLTWAGPAPNSFGSLNGSPPTDPCDPPPPGPYAPVAVTEFHYDNAGGDVNEAIEVSGPAGTDLECWSIVLYNGNGGAPYDTIDLGGVIPDESGGEGAVAFARAGIQNGAPDGFALVTPDGAVTEFLSYEGDFVAAGGPADGQMSTDVGVAEDGGTGPDDSLQLISGMWTGPAPNSFGLLNSEPPVVDNCPNPPDITLIHEIQGDGETTPCDGEDVIIEGVVVGDFEGPSPELRGFYLQEEDADADADPNTSEGVFVFNGDADSVNLGDQVRVEGTATEFQGQTQISFSTTTFLASDQLALVSETEVFMPFAAADSLEAVESMLVTFPQPLFVTEYFQLGRFGQVVVSSGDRLDQPTTVAEPGPDANAVQAANNLNRVIIDDTTNDQNPEPIIYGGNGAPLTAANPLRGGDTTTGATGVMTFTWAGNSASGNAYRLRPTVEPIAFTTANPRPTEVPDVGGSIQVASFNVLNYFLTVDDGGNNCGPIGAKAGCRGADSDLEFERQRTKLLAALSDIDADVLGLIELENTELDDGTVVEPLADLVAGLNDAAGADVWDYVDTGAVGTDVIKVGYLYKPASVSPVGDTAIIDSSVDPRFDDTRNRPTIAQSFVENSTGEVLTVVNNHLKSKSCRNATGANADQGDGAGCWNESRTLAAQAIVDWLATAPTGVADDDVMVIGDLNSYAKEDPIDVFIAAGFTDLAPVFEDDPYSFVFSGQWGYLDYALASPSLVDQVTGAAEYHINADEVPVLDYNTDFQSDQQIMDLYAPDQFRTSDHDPVIVGLSLDAGPPGKVIAFPPILWPVNGKLRNVYVFGFDKWRLIDTEILGVTSSEADSGLGPRDRPGDIVIVNDYKVRLRAERFSKEGRTYTIAVQINGDGQIRIVERDVRVPGRRW